MAKMIIYGDPYKSVSDVTNINNAERFRELLWDVVDQYKISVTPINSKLFFIDDEIYSAPFIDLYAYEIAFVKAERTIYDLYICADMIDPSQAATGDVADTAILSHWVYNAIGETDLENSKKLLAKLDMLKLTKNYKLDCFRETLNRYTQMPNTVVGGLMEEK